jgi:hypothetical protein
VGEVLDLHFEGISEIVGTDARAERHDRGGHVIRIVDG